MSKVPPLTGVVGTLPLPNTTPTPEAGETVKAADVQLAAQGLLNQDATLEAYVNDGAHRITPGEVVLGGVSPAKDADPGANNILVGSLVCKAWATLTVGGGAVTLLDGANIDNQTLTGVGSDAVEITFVREMANALYAVTWGVEDDATNVPIPMLNSTKSVTGFQFNLWKSADGSLIDLAIASSRKVTFHVMARQVSG